MAIFDLKKILNVNKDRFDIVVRYLYVEDRKHKPLYIKMQDKRSIERKVIYNTINKFDALIESVKKVNYDDRYPIIVNKNLNILDGSHRVACCLAFDKEFIEVHIKDTDVVPLYGIDWFEQNGFTNKELELIKTKHGQIFEKLLKLKE